MSPRLLALALLLGSAHVLAPQAAAEAPTLTLSGIMALAREQGPAARIAEQRLKVARASLEGASVVNQTNPVLSASGGPRIDDGVLPQAEVMLSVPVEIAGERGKRVRLAESRASRESFAAQFERWRAVGRAMAAFFRVLHAQDLVALARDRVALAEELRGIARAREKAGDIAQFEVDLTDGEVSRATSSLAAAEGALSEVRGVLAVVLGLPATEEIRASGELGDRSAFDAIPKTLEPAERPDIRVVRASEEAALAELALAEAEAWPELAFTVRYAHEDNAEIVLAGVSLTLPVFERGQGAVAEARARQSLARVTAETMTGRAGAEAESARAAYRHALEAVRILESRGLPLATENEALAVRSYRAGKIDLASLFIVRREAVETRKEHLDRLLAAALAGTNLWVKAGVDPAPKE